MFIFTRTRTIDMGRATEAIASAGGITDLVTDLTGLVATTWYQTYAPTGPALVWTARLEHMEEFDKTTEVLMASADYQEAITELDESFTGPVVDNLVEIVAGTLPEAPTQYASSVQATATNGHLRAATHWGADLAERFGRSLDIPTIFGRGLYGTYGTMFWAGYYDDINQVEGTHAKMATDEMLQAVVDEGAHNCQPGAIQTMMRRLS